MELMIGIAAAAALMVLLAVALLMLDRKRIARAAGVAAVGIVAVGVAFAAEGAISRQRCIDKAEKFEGGIVGKDGSRLYIAPPSAPNKSDCKFDPP